MSAEDFVGHRSTVSAYLELPGALRTEALTQVLAVLPATVAVDADITAHLARSVPSDRRGGTVGP